MDTYELQVYKRDKWEFDSYFNDRESALDEARRMIKTTRHGGVRLLADKYDEDTKKSGCAVVFSHMLKGDVPARRKKVGATTDWGKPTTDRHKKVAGTSNKVRRGTEANSRAPRRPVVPPKKKSLVFKMLAIAVCMLTIGVGVMVWLSGSVNF
jgi:hypothetical protein